MREIKFRCFYRGTMYPVKELFFGDGGGGSVSCIEMVLDGEVKSATSININTYSNEKT